MGQCGDQTRPQIVSALVADVPGYPVILSDSRAATARRSPMPRALPAVATAPPLPHPYPAQRPPHN